MWSFKYARNPPDQPYLEDMGSVATLEALRFLIPEVFYLNF